MKNIMTIMRRDLGAYFTSPIGYMYMVVFLLISVGLYITSFFTFPVADMRAYFSNLPIMLCVFIPAVTMRVWAEERKENTWELLLTFPMTATELVLGKFLSCVTFFTLTLAGTITIPVMLIWLGNPDDGALFGAYFGTMLLGAFFLALGIFVSGFCRDQIVAFVITLLACFALFLLGTSFIASYIDGVVPGLGSILGVLVGVLDHYNAFTRGVVDLVDVFYFVGWTALLLYLNILYIDVRNRTSAKMVFMTALLLCAGIGLLFNWFMQGQSFGRLDLTEDKTYTISEASKSILSKVDGSIRINYYVTPKGKMPTEYSTLEQDVLDKLEELRVASGGKVTFTPVYLEAANITSTENVFGQEEPKDEPQDETKAVEERMLDKGVRPFSVQAISGDQFTNKLIYSSLGIAYKNEQEEILPQVIPQVLPEMEYRLVSTVYKLTREKKPIIALVAPKEASNIPPQQRALLQQLGQPVPEEEDPYSLLERVLLGEKYDVQRVTLTKDAPLPAEYDTMVVVNPRDLDERQRWEINRALVAGKSVVLAVQLNEWDYQTTRRGINANMRKTNPGVNELLSQYGITVSGDVLMDVNHVPLNISSGNPLSDALGMGQPVDLPTHMLLNESMMNADTSITNRLSAVFYLWGSALALDDAKLKEHTLNAQVLMHTSDRAWTSPADAEISSDMFTEPTTAGGKEYPLMAMVTGQFPDVYKDKPVPAWAPAPPMPGMPPEPEQPELETPAPVTPAPGKLIVVGCAQMFRDEMLRSGGSNLDLFMNSVDALTLTDDLVHIRGKKPIQRYITMPNESDRTWWRIANYGLVNAVIAFIGIGVTLVRRRSRNVYTMSQMRGKG